VPAESGQVCIRNAILSENSEGVRETGRLVTVSRRVMRVTPLLASHFACALEKWTEQV
jgi:hypothetical protein